MKKSDGTTSSNITMGILSCIRIINISFLIDTLDNNPTLARQLSLHGKLHFAKPSTRGLALDQNWA